MTTDKRLRVLMLGWEYPPEFTGGLGVATEGLVAALSNQADVYLMLPQHRAEMPNEAKGAGAEPNDIVKNPCLGGYQTYAPKDIPERWQSPMSISEAVRERVAKLQEKAPSASKRLYGDSLMEQVEAFADQACKEAATLEFDVIHANDWMTFPAAMRIKEQSEKPLIVHVHSLETDRAADVQARNPVYEVEREAVGKAEVVLAVSSYTKELLQQQYGANPEQTFVVHNGTEPLPGVKLKPTNAMNNPEEKKDGYNEWALLNGEQPYWMNDYQPPKEKKRKKQLVLFLGRVTAQKGPLTFIRTAKRLLTDNQQMKFTVAGLGDQLEEMIQLAEDEQIANFIEFKGFVKRKKLKKLLKKSDVLFVPSVSEPFGLVALEAAQLGLPIVISKQSGVAEVLPGILMAEYWDSQLFARHIRMLLTYKDLRRGLGKANQEAVKQLTWDKAAGQIVQHYEGLLGNE